MGVDEELPPWARRADNEGAEPRRRSRPWILVAAVVPWVLVVAVVAGALLHDPDDPAAATSGPAEHTSGDPVEHADDDEEEEEEGEQPLDAEGVEDAGSPPAADAPHDGDHDTAAAPPGEASDAARQPAPSSGADAEELARSQTTAVGAVALTVARAWLTDVGPRLEIDGVEPLEDRYLEHAVVERIEHHGDHAVATVLAVVLTREGDHYVDAEPRRLAVPVHLAGPPRPAGAPWWLDPVDLSPADLESTTEVDDDGLVELAEALGAAEIDDELLGASHTPDGWWITELDSGEQVWLRPGPAGPVVAGAPGAARQEADESSDHDDDEASR